MFFSGGVVSVLMTRISLCCVSWKRVGLVDVVSPGAEGMMGDGSSPKLLMVKNNKAEKQNAMVAQRNFAIVSAGTQAKTEETCKEYVIIHTL